ncbi:endolytic transglycosylase MltG [Microbacterium sp. H1-D42]|uniref:endolytic transglycosylase MltG n=1 Tax=Microbacterium sp. H1-D42 TaxID=2925844 RepID=UPI001F52E848|nr:endolytic transglycosylase MltG [Microbacterium sp. H1-D42]UNK72454.1 endolytic transglycosylase MltG [Microbacterium sp. H1-D42]
MPEPDARNGAVPNDLFGSLPTARSPLADLHARSAPAPGSRRALREAAEQDAAAREAVARHAAQRHGVDQPAPQPVTPPQATPPQQTAPQSPASDSITTSTGSVRTAAHDAGIAALMAPSTATWPVPVQAAAAQAAPTAHSAQVPDPQAPAAHEPDAQDPVPFASPVQAAVEPADGEQATERQLDDEQDEDEEAADEPGSLNSLFAPEQHHDVPKKKRGRGCLIGLLVVLVVLGGIAAGGVWVWNQYGDKISDVMGWGPSKDYEAGMAEGEALVTIKTGDTGAMVSTSLYSAKVTKTDSAFYDYLIAENKAITFYPGVYKMQQKMTAAAALAALEDPANRMENTVSVGEGGTVAATLPRIVDGVGIPLEELQAAVKDPKTYGVQAATLEGWLFPAVYTFDPGATAQDVIKAMVDRTQEALSAAGVAPADAQRILTIASIVQREGHTADFDKVSRVIENRLDPANDETHGLLQMDSTAQYGYGLTHEGPVSSWPWDAVVNDQNPWNTYAHAGLPASPISNPSEAAIKAAQNPADGPWFYFVTVNLDTGETVFSATYAEQQAAEAEYQKWCEDNPDGGCY